MSMLLNRSRWIEILRLLQFAFEKQFAGPAGVAFQLEEIIALRLGNKAQLHERCLNGASEVNREMEHPFDR